MKINYKELAVVKSNKIIEAKYKLSARAQKFILLMASMIETKDEEFKFQTIRIKDIESILNADGTKWGGLYQEIKDIVMSLNNSPLKITNEDGSVLIVNWIASAEIRKGKGVIEFEFSEKLKPYLLQLKSHFTKFKLHNILKLKSSFSIRLYELMKARQFLGQARYTINALKTILGIEGKYKTYYDFKRRVILPAQKELAESSDICFEYEELKEGRAVKTLIFKIKENRKVTETIDVSKESLEVNKELIEAIKKLGFTTFKAVELCQLGFEVIADVEIRKKVMELYPSVEAFLEDKIGLVKFDAKNKKITNIAGYFLRALQENYQNEDYLNFKKRKEQKVKNSKVNALKQQYLQLYEAQRKLFIDQQQQIIQSLIENNPKLIDQIIEDNHLKAKKEDYYSKVVLRSKINFLITKAYPKPFESLKIIETNMNQLKRSIDTM